MVWCIRLKREVICKTLKTRIIQNSKMEIRQASSIFALVLMISALGVSSQSVKEKSEKNVTVPPDFVDKERLLTLDEKVAFDKFKRLVWPHIFRDEIKHQLFLLRWIRAKNLDVELALKDFIAFKNWYFENNMANITKEEWRDLEYELPFHIDAVDREGRPVGYLTFREGWDFRSVILQGKRRRFERYLMKITFDLVLHVWEANKQNPNVTQFIVLISADGFNMMQQGCPMCIRSLISLLNIYERFLPGFAKEVVIVESPQMWSLYYNAFYAMLTPSTRHAVKFFDSNKSMWVPYLHKRIDPSQLPGFLGGNKRDDNDQKL